MPKSKVKVIWVFQIIVHQRSIVNVMQHAKRDELRIATPVDCKKKNTTIARNIIVWMIKHTTKLVLLVLEIVVLKYKCITKFLFTTKTEILCDM